MPQTPEATSATAPIVYGPRMYAALIGLSRQYGVEISTTHSSLEGVPTIRVGSVHQVEILADAFETGVVEVEGRYSCTVEIADRLVRFEAFRGHPHEHPNAGYAVHLDLLESSVVVDDWLDRMPSYAPTALASPRALAALTNQQGEDGVVYGHIGRVPVLIHNSEIVR